MAVRCRLYKEEKEGRGQVMERQTSYLCMHTSTPVGGRAIDEGLEMAKRDETHLCCKCETQAYRTEQQDNTSTLQPVERRLDEGL